MRAILYDACGPPEVLRCAEIARPSPGEQEVLIEVRAASVNPLDAGELHGIPAIFRLLFGMRAPTAREPGHLGVEVAGEVGKHRERRGRRCNLL
jgi:NADPH:quinone reductase-like Zn-dependent oxidoreductase